MTAEAQIIIDEVAQAFQRPPGTYHESNREQITCEFRFACWWIFRRMVRVNLKQVSIDFGKPMDHGTILHGVRRAGDLAELDPRWGRALALAYDRTAARMLAKAEQELACV